MNFSSKSLSGVILESFQGEIANLEFGKISSLTSGSISLSKGEIANLGFSGVCLKSYGGTPFLSVDLM